MRTLYGFVLMGVLVFGGASLAEAQMLSTGAGPAAYSYYSAPAAPAGSARGYAFKDEPLMSINRSYLGYSNFVYYGPGSPSPYATAPGTAPARGYVAGSAAPPTYYYYARPPARRGLFGWRRGYGY